MDRSIFKMTDRDSMVRVQKLSVNYTDELGMRAIKIKINEIIEAINTGNIQTCPAQYVQTVHVIKN